MKFLKREQKEAAALLQIGTFLEYFDVMLYVHMAVFLNGLFFPKTDPHTASLLTAFAFCSTYVMRPFGAIVFGYIGDTVGRKATVIVTTMMMSLACIVMANLPTYSEVGIAAAWAVTICRIIQGMSSMGEIIGAEIYLTEITRPPSQYPIVGLVGFSSALGALAALLLASAVTSFGFNWRIAFWGGAAVALVGTLARTRLRETPDFVDLRRRMKRAIEEAGELELTRAAELLKKTNRTWKEKTSWKTILACFIIQSAWPVFFYFSYMYCSGILKDTFNYSGEAIIHQNMFVAIVQVVSFLMFVLLSYKIYPLKLLKFKILIIFPWVLLFPYILSHVSSPFELFLVQSVSIFFALNGGPAMPIIIKHFPVFRRFTYNSFIYALSRALVYLITSFGLIYLIEIFGYYGLWIILIPTILGVAWSTYYFERQEKITLAYDGQNLAT